MKGAIIAVGLWVMSVGISWGLLYYHSAERLRQSTVFAMRQALSETMVVLMDDPAPSAQRALSHFVENFSPRQEAHVAYVADVMGFNANPLLLTIRLSYTDTRGAFDLALSVTETMIEVDHA
jgi:hypothetical protein